jgi:hypothetical protein
MTTAVSAKADAAERPAEAGRWRRVASWALVVLASLIGFISVLTVWVDRQLLDNAAWQQASTDVIQDPEVRNALSVYLVNQLYDNVNVSEQLGSKLPPALKPLAAPISAALREPAGNGVDFLLARPRLQDRWIQATTLAHQKLLNVLEDKTGYGISTGNGVVTLDLGSLVRELGTELGVPAAALDKLPPDAGVITVMQSDQLSAAQQAVRGIKAASAWLALLVVAMFALAVYLARPARREMLRNVGWAFVVVGLLVLIVRRLGGNYVIDALVSPSYDETGHRVWLIGTQILGETGRAVVFYGATVLVAAILAGPTNVAVATRRRLAPFFRDRMGVCWGAVAVVYLLLVLWAPTYALRRPVWILVFGVLLAAGVELLRRQTLREFPAVAPEAAATNGAGARPRTPLLQRTRRQGSPADEIAKLQELQRTGAIDDEEFNRAKQIALS